MDFNESGSDAMGKPFKPDMEINWKEDKGDIFDHNWWNSDLL